MTRHLVWLVVSTFVRIPGRVEGADAQLAEGSPALAADGAVTGLASIGNTLYLLGSFGSIGPNTGGGVPVDPSTGRPLSCYARVAGTVLACVSDGCGGWYLGGDFTGVGGAVHANVAHVRGDGSVTPWRVDADGPVRALALDGETLYLGGDFTHVRDQERDHLASVSARSGELSAWNPSVAGAYAFTTVYCVLPVSGTVYVGGDFTSVQGVDRSCLVALDRGFPRVEDFNAAPDGPVHALAYSDGSVYVGGIFYNVGQQPFHGLARVDALTGTTSPWQGSISSPAYEYDLEPYVSALAIADTSLYVVGHFTRVDGQLRGGIAAVSLSTGQIESWNPNPLDETLLRQAPFVYSLGVSGDDVYVAGAFGSVGPTFRLNIAAISRTTGSAIEFNPRANAEAYAIGMGSGAIYVGGRFSSLGTWQYRNRLAAIDLQTGTLTSWSPDPGYGQVMCMATDQHAIYIGGRFTDINGVARQNIAAIDPVSGDLTNWNPGADNGTFTAVYTLAVGGGWVYAGGDFGTMGGLARRNLAAIDTSGRVGAWDPEPNFWVRTIRPAGSTIYVGGGFDHVGSEPRVGLAEVDTVLGTPTPWNPGTDEEVFTIAVSDSVVYVGGQFLELGGAPRASLGAVDRTTGAVTSWDPAAVNSPYASVPIIRALALEDGALYVAGDFSQIGGGQHFFAAALDTASGKALAWNPDISLGPGESAGPMFSLLEKEHVIYFGGLVWRYGVAPAGGYGTWPAIAAAPVARTQVAVGACYPNPVTKDATLSFVLPGPAQVSLTVFDLQGRRVGRALANAARPAGAQSARIHVEGWAPGCYLCRLDVGGTAITRKLVVVRR